MGQQVLPTLSAEVRLETGGLTRDAAAVIAANDQMAKSGVTGWAKTEDAVKRASDTSGVVAGVKRAAAGYEQLGNAATAAGTKIGSAYATVGEVTTAAQRAVEKSAESMILQLEREAVAIGKTRDARRDAKVEALALAAAESGQTDIADRLLAAARQRQFAVQAVAEAEAAAAVAATQAAERKAQEDRSATRAYEMFNAVAKERMAIYAQQQAAEATLHREAEAVRERAAAEAAVNAQLMERSRLEAALDRTMGKDRPSATQSGATYSALTTKFLEDEAQAAREAAHAHDLFEAAARRGAQAMREQEAAEQAAARETEALAAATQRLRASIDPAFAAQQRFDQEMGQARTLIAAGAISLDEYCAKLRVEQGALEQANNTHGEATKKSGALRYAFQDLGYQIQDVGASLSTVSGPSGLFRIFAQQGGQVFDALNRISMASADASKDVKGTGDASGEAGTDIGGLGDQMVGVADKVEKTGSKFSAVAGFMAGPWGAAILVGITVLGPLVGKLFETNNALDDAVSKLKEEAKATEASDQAKKLFKHSVEGVTAAIREQAAAYEQLANGERSAAQRQNILARETYNAAVAIRDKTKADLEAQRVQAQADYNNARVRASAPGQRGENAALGLGTADAALAARIQAIDAAIRTADETALQASKNYQASRVGLAKETAKAVATAEGRINAAYDEQATNATIAGYAAVKRGEVVDGALTRELEGIERNRQAALKAEQDRQNAAKQTATQIGRNITLAEARTIAEGIGGRVTSDHRSYAEQQKLYGKYQAFKAGTGPWAALAAKPGTSNHELDQALDVAKSGGMTLKKLVGAYQAAGVKLVEALDEGDHYHIAWKKVGAQATQQSAEITAAARDALQAAAGQAQIANLYDLADAYKATGGEALLAEARLKAESEAIKQHGDAEAAVGRQIQIAVAQRVADGAQATSAMNEQAGAQERVNAQVAAGLIPASQAGQALQDQLALLPLVAAQEAALKIAREAAANGDVARQAQYEAAAVRAGQQIAAETATQQRLNNVRRDAQYLGSLANGDDELARLKLEGQLIGANVDQRAHELAVLKAIQDEKSQGFTVIPELDAAVQQAGKLADQAQINLHNNDAYNASLTQTADHWDIIAGKVQSAGQGMADAFGSAGRAIGDLASIYAGYQASRTRADAEHAAAIRAAGTNEQLLAQENARFALQSSGAQIAAYGDMASAAKGFFKEGSAGYQALSAAEKVFRAVQFALSVKAMAQNAIETGASIAKSGLRAAAHAVEAVVKAIASLPFPANLIAGAATAAAIAKLGVSIAGGTGGGNSALPKANTGAGTVLGDSTKGSDSIKNSIDALSKVDQLTNAYSREMAASLKSIDSQIGSVAAVLVRSGNISADGGVAQGFKANAIGSALGAIPLVGGILKGLFGSTTTVTGSGLTQGGRSLGDILDNGFAANTYSDVEKKSKLFGITTGRSSSTVIGGSADASVNQQFGLILKSFDAAIVAAAGPLGESTQAIADKVKFFVFDLGKVDLKGLTGDQIQEKLSNIFGAAADGMAAAAFPGIERFQKVGEGAFETLTRVASTVEAVTTALDQLGTSSAALGIDAKMGLAAQFDSLSDMSSAVGAYFQAYYTAEEQAAAKTAQMGKMFDSLGLAMPASLAGFRQLVEAQDLTSAAGQSTYATLLQLAPAFADLNATMDGAKSAADILSERMDLQKQLWQALGDTAAIRAAELAALDPSNRALQQRLYDLADEAAATEAANRIAQERKGIETQLLQLQGDTVTQRRNELAALDPANRALQAQVYALQDQQAAAAAAAQAEQEAAQAAAGIAQERAGLEQQLLQAQGDTVAIRAAELAALDPSNRALQQRLHDLQDEAAAAQAAAAVAQERSGLESQLLQLQGDTAALRARELAALDPSNRAIQEMIYALTDLQAAAQAAAAVAQERAGIQQQLWQLEGNTAAIRAAELAGLDASNRALMEQVYALQDQQAATQAASQAAQEAAQAEQAIAQERAGLMQQLWQLTGDTASIRAAALAALDPSNRALQQQIYAIQDAQEAAKAAADLSSAWKSIGDTITDEVNRIRGLTEAQAATGGFAALQGQFNAAVAAARAGDQAAAKGLPDLSKSLLDVAATSATSSQELARVQAETAAMLESVTSRIASATYASDAMTNPVLGSAGGNPGSSSWWARFAGGADAPARIAANDGGDGGGASSGDIDELKDEMSKLRADLTDALAQLAGYARTTANALTRSLGQGGGDGLAVVVQAAA